MIKCPSYWSYLKNFISSQKHYFISNFITECADDLTRFDSVKLNVSSSKSGTYVNGSRIHSRYAWCANTAATTEYIQVDLGAIRRITGFGIQGDTGNDQWATKVKFGVSNCSSVINELATVRYFYSDFISHFWK